MKQIRKALLVLGLGLAGGGILHLAGMALTSRVAAGAAQESETGDEVVRLYSVADGSYYEASKLALDDTEWKKRLSLEEFRVTRRAGTERPFTGRYWDHHGEGVYRCVACGTDLFASDTKFESGTGWPSFYQPVAPENLIAESDRSWGMVRTEVLCARCQSHLGHVFRDGPPPTGLRYCINSAALIFAPQEKGEDHE